MFLKILGKEEKNRPSHPQGIMALFDRCIFILIMTLLVHRNTATTKKLDFKNSHLTSVGAINKPPGHLPSAAKLLASSSRAQHLMMTRILVIASQCPNINLAVGETKAFSSAFWFLGTWVKFDPKKGPRTLNGHNFRPSMTHEV